MRPLFAILTLSALAAALAAGGGLVALALLALPAGLAVGSACRASGRPAVPRPNIDKKHKLTT